jgi:hypothetical protein
MQRIKIKHIPQAKSQPLVLEQTTTADAHNALFGNENTHSVPPKTLQELKQGIERYMRNKHTQNKHSEH